jgi:hypothetical protein
MIPRPKATDTMADVLKMQNDYLRQKNEENFKPAAAVVTMKSPGRFLLKFFFRNFTQPLVHFRIETISVCKAEESQAIRKR